MPIFIFRLYVNGNFKLPYQAEVLSDLSKKKKTKKKKTKKKKKTLFNSPPIAAICEVRIGSMASEEMSFENVGDDDECLAILYALL